VDSVRRISYTILPPIGPDELEEEGSLLEFLLNLPHLFYFGYVPSLEVINSFLAEGVDDAGMSGGCRWEPFQITPADYEEVIERLKNIANPSHKFVQVPDYVINKLEWFAWVMHEEIGIPFKEHLQLMIEEETYQKLHRQACVAGDHQRVEELHWLWYEAAKKLQAFSDVYMERYLKDKDSC
jgi:hypothetical protein